MKCISLHEPNIWNQKHCWRNVGMMHRLPFRRLRNKHLCKYMRLNYMISCAPRCISYLHIKFHQLWFRRLRMKKYNKQTSSQTKQTFSQIWLSQILIFNISDIATMINCLAITVYTNHSHIIHRQISVSIEILWNTASNQSTIYKPNPHTTTGYTKQFLSSDHTCTSRKHLKNRKHIYH